MLVAAGQGPQIRGRVETHGAVEADDLLDVVLDVGLVLVQRLRHNPDHALAKCVFRAGERVSLERLADGLADGLGQLGGNVHAEPLRRGELGDERLEFSGSPVENGGRGQKDLGDLFDRHAPLHETEPAEQGQFGRGQVGLIGLKQAGEAKGLAILLRRGELGHFGCPARVAVEKVADQ